MSRVPIVVKFGPSEEGAAILAGNISGVAHPEIPPKVLLLSLHHSQNAGYLAFAPGGTTRVHVGFVVPVCDIDSLVPSDRVGIDRWGGSNAVLPFLLHFSMHNEQ
jgi:hypothetical protein